MLLGHLHLPMGDQSSPSTEPHKLGVMAGPGTSLRRAHTCLRSWPKFCSVSKFCSSYIFKLPCLSRLYSPSRLRFHIQLCIHFFFSMKKRKNTGDDGIQDYGGRSLREQLFFFKKQS